MHAFLLSRLTIVWGLLLSASVVSWALGHENDIPHIAPASVAILAVAALKVRFVIFDFMEIRHAPRFMRWVADAWLVFVWSMMIGMYLATVH
jgi:hypothetical protein